MEACETCGNKYDKMLEITYGTDSHTYDSFECAIHGLAPTCSRCSMKIIGHGVETNGEFFCCAHCARHEGKEGLRDRQDESVFL